ncbi:endoglucanase [Modestobacter sp. DSM 44400]|uniref:glycosyl hydrolase family 8 n=1 Tax=Modestobacter sp. DSM 44400 TaxID=1550230 RepID=UPI0008976B0E|nr:glycosyl hydrolase family 8 [Modestobacter sp. DSM 44400]SDY67670.1 endoglucanase [Modestobacter sp. DSM 44400]
MSRRLRLTLVAVGALAVVLAALSVGLVMGGGGDPRADGGAVGRPPASSSGAESTAIPGVAPGGLVTYTAAEAGTAFLDGFVDPDGRVVRTDQGGDTVSEGQAYAMLVAVGVGDDKTFRAVWNWTAENLQRPDGLLSWRWNDGSVQDRSSASDADLDAARALVLAGTAFGDPSYTADGVRLGKAVLDLETVQTDAGRILAAGQWAMTEPYAYNPSYASPAASAVLAAASGDPRWAELDTGSRTVTATLLDQAPLPPDWAQVHADGRVDAMPGAQGRGQSVRYGYDAARTPIRFAESCDPADRALAAEMLAPLDRGGDAAELDLGGAPMAETESAVAAAGQAAAVAASGDVARAADELVDADHLPQLTPTYYGAAWAALGRFMLTDDVLGGCPPAPAAP